MTTSKPTPEPQPGGDEQVIDLTDAALAAPAPAGPTPTRSPSAESQASARPRAVAAPPATTRVDDVAAPPGDEPIDDVVIDLRDPLPPETAKHRPVSGRPLDLAPGLRLVELVDRDDELWQAAERFVYDTYVEVGYCEPSPRGVVEELQRYAPHSTFHVVFDDEGTVVGTARGILGPFAELPVGTFERVDHRDDDPLVELSSLCVTPTARGISVVVHLCRAVFVDAWRRGAHALVFAIDDWMVELLAGSYRLPVRDLGIRRHYMGGDTTPTAMTLVGAEFEVTARDNPGYWQWMTEAYTPAEIVAWELPIVLTDPAPPTPVTADAPAGRSAPRASR